MGYWQGLCSKSYKYGKMLKLKIVKVHRICRISYFYQKLKTISKLRHLTLHDLQNFEIKIIWDSMIIVDNKLDLKNLQIYIFTVSEAYTIGFE